MQRDLLGRLENMSLRIREITTSTNRADWLVRELSTLIDQVPLYG